jgi:putative addiction module component (TIGR02574 family)
VAKIDDLRDAAMQLSVEERSWLAQDLLDSLRSDEERAIEAEWVEIAERRLDEIEAGTARLVPAEDALKRARARLRAARRTSRRS